MFSFGGKKRKNAFFFEKFLSLTKFPTSPLCACEQLGAPHWKSLKKLTCFKKRNFYDFLKNHNFQKLTTDFENRTKRQAETEACACLDVDH